MSEPVSALNNASYDGIARIAEDGLHGMITLRGDLSAKAVKAAARAVAGADVPDAGCIAGDSAGGLCWMSPDELLLLCPHAQVDANVETLRQALDQTHALVANVSDARALLRVTGPAAREVMAKLCPVDLSPAAFEPGMFRRTRMAQVPAAIWMTDDETFQIICFRSVAQYVFGLLRVAAQPGSAVNAF
ncbi:sarcosine oxidase subunit gamma [Sedimentitalea todarodis]|uniref:Sarcosine oxidase subunit gamma family protein n=1 Tax=Sedimentitalea todarodis TaxID=1631240 RepID=A0ABU3VLK8_9RHOB|nr:sarcosine oxidase subunit gamma family protein [Sedimentitalea todarodis]MDU9007061.1 sarcosine oxidase subunit gamma family protein [Sedimentitalea todarodis]